MVKYIYENSVTQPSNYFLIIYQKINNNSCNFNNKHFNTI